MNPKNPQAASEGSRPKGFGIACTVAWTELHQAIIKDGIDVTAGKCGPAVREWIVGVVRDTFAATPVIAPGGGLLESIRALVSPLQFNAISTVFREQTTLPAAANAERDRDAKDAARYRWLRDGGTEELCARARGDNPIHPHLWAHWPIAAEYLDNAIDAAIAAGGEGTGS